jgi:hypothetical protein
MNHHKLALTLTLTLGFGLGLACSDDGGGGEAAGTCEPGETIDCACPDGTTEQQTCAEDGKSYEDCPCDGAETGGDGDGDPSGDGDGDGDGDPSGDGDGDGDGDPSGDGDGDGDGDPSGDGDGEPVGEAPVASIFHPGDGEVRPVNVPIPFIGEAIDAEDGALAGTSVVWTSDLDGELGTGLMFDAPLTMVGLHTITMTATDSDQQQGIDSIQLTIE